MTGPEIAAAGKAVAAPAGRMALRALAARHPVRLELIDEALDYMRAWVVVTPQRIDRATAPEGLPPNELREWLVNEQEAIASGEGFATLVVTNTSKQYIRIAGLAAEVVDRGPGYPGSRVECEPAGASDVEGVFFDLDVVPSTALTDRWPDEQPPSQDHFRRRQVALSPEESINFALRAKSAAGYCRWRPVVTVVVGRRRVTASTDLTLELSSSQHAEKLAYRWWERPQRIVTVAEAHPQG